MADDFNKLAILIEANTKAYERAMAKVQASTDKALGAASGSAKKVDKALKSIESQAGITGGALLRMLGPLAGVASFAGFTKLSDAAIRVENSLKVAGLQGEELAAVYERLFASAQKNAAPVEALVELYGRAALVQKELGVSTGELLGFTDKIALALRVSGKSASESSGALLQLSQALGSGTVRAEEFNSILEGALPIAQAAAAGLEEAGGSVAKLRQLVVDGKVSSEAFFRAFEAGSGILEEKVANASFTAAQGMTRLENSMIDAVARINEATGAGSALGSTLAELAGHVQKVGEYFDRNAPRIGAFFDEIRAGWEWLEKSKSNFRGWLGLDVIDDFLAGTSLVEGRIGFLSEQIAENQRRIDEAWGENAQRIARLGKGDRPGSAPTTVSLSDFAAPGSKKKAGRSQSDRDAETIRGEQQAIAEYLDTLRQEHDLIGATALEREKANAVRRLGMSATDEQVAAVERLIEANYREAESQKAIMAAVNELSDTATGFYRDFVSGLRQGEGAAKSFGDAVTNTLNRIADKLAEQAIMNFISSIFGVPVTGTPGFGGFGLGKAGGGHVEAGVAIPVGERGPEIFVPNTAGKIVANHNVKQGGGHVSVGVTVDDEGALRAYVRKTVGAGISAAAPGIAQHGAMAAKANYAQAGGWTTL